MKNGNLESSILQHNRSDWPSTFHQGVTCLWRFGCFDMK